MPEPYAEADKVEILQSAVDAFREREVGFRDMLEELPAAVYATDAEGRISFFNRACVEFSGKTPALADDHSSLTWKLYTADGLLLPHEQSPMAIALKEERIVRGDEAVAERPDGSRVHFAPHSAPIFDAAGQCVGTIHILVDTTEQWRENERLSLLAREVDHRSNNLLSLIQSLVRLTRANSVEDYRAELEGRIIALARANALIAEKRWSDTDLRSLMQQEFEPVSERIVFDGPDLQLSPSSAQSLAMIVHELCTNAQKYGALSSDAGQVRVSWAIDDSGAFMLAWEEVGGPPTTEPLSKNMGNAIIAAAARHLKASFFRDWRASGLHCTLLCNTANL